MVNRVNRDIKKMALYLIRIQFVGRNNRYKQKLRNKVNRREIMKQGKCYYLREHPLNRH